MRHFIRNTNRWILLCFLLFQSGLCLADASFNIIVLPDSINSFDCHQVGVEFKVAQNHSVGMLGRFDCETNRSTYGDTHDDVTNTFSRILIPWRYSKNGVFKDGIIIQALVGVEKSEFRSKLGSKADVTFVDFGIHYGYQWFWENGFNISALAGVAYLVETSSEKSIVQNENSDVINWLDKNTKTNIHGGAGIMIGWKF